MNISIFNRNYRVRRFGEQRYVRGYAASCHTDMMVSLHVHPVGKDTIQVTPGGERKVKRLEAHGTDVLCTANHDAGLKGDLLYYKGAWYECVSAVEYDHTLLSHWNYEFVIVPKDVAGTVDLTDEEDEEDEGE